MGKSNYVFTPSHFPHLNCYIGCIVVYAVHAILVIRLYCIYRSKRLLYLISAFLFLASVAEVYMVVARGPTAVIIFMPGVGDICVPLNIKELSVVW